MIRFSLESKPWLSQQKMWRRRRERGRRKEKRSIDENKKERNVSTPKSALSYLWRHSQSKSRQWASDAMKSTETQNTHDANNLEITHTHVQYANTVQHTWRTVHTRALGRGQHRKIKQGKVGQSPLQKHHFYPREQVGLSLLRTFTHAHLTQDWDLNFFIKEVKHSSQTMVFLICPPQIFTTNMW